MKSHADNRKLTTDNLPKHVAFIMDGNRRWARKKGLDVFLGHDEGEERIEPLIDYAIEKGIPYLTFWAFSTENWKRDQKEVEFLLNLFRNDLAKRVDSFHQKNVRLNVIGNLAMFPKDIQKRTQEWMERTKNNTKITVNVALSYGGRDEIIRAIKKITSYELSGEARSRSARRITNLTSEKFSKLLDTAGQPDVDLLIRTGGEQRLSGFLLWQLEYAELYFTETLWPDFTQEEFEKALIEFQKRQRRFGK
ncbi:di-trans,poly-cis-decaprenylcistransferase [Candidatus Roizmanbacteria bacterium RIFCSPLOWO2_01_FULL_40_14]|uniref:Isoprenyl transferase n=3 Tax=Candidatus Roizmaniibacteriota TaxID=1752723 RepID=A0A0G0XD05_9BACT|nr:MAG: Isoprenyl transferase [Candidatus Levybacteria bacterium GW2011_GWA2_40_16]KKR72325.1 MAG: Isoprenyl transferase [Candidatus Roizmanbacteria bacterium GW2011_GWB1_40_7]KKR93183.1 MAG: Isoprenyl transferase [Candidatus Roizmanbacteria bacterium GW2011_GWA1_41_13]KKS22824.1 MAG: Isoprenyl transferase [Candidatus Roizmanbacteria bacterium GW2011_GWC2_41_7]OGK49809.1 MAG: di-trans,poly-cis-decaprenylcistransferase [Candidatus Roizmanbacteria bacterium RIFCSPLOWO2_01_FULL_40_14]